MRRAKINSKRQKKRESSKMMKKKAQMTYENFSLIDCVLNLSLLIIHYIIKIHITNNA